MLRAETNLFCLLCHFLFQLLFHFTYMPGCTIDGHGTACGDGPDAKGIAACQDAEHHIWVYTGPHSVLDATVSTWARYIICVSTVLIIIICVQHSANHLCHCHCHCWWARYIICVSTVLIIIIYVQHIANHLCHCHCHCSSQPQLELFEREFHPSLNIRNVSFMAHFGHLQ